MLAEHFLWSERTGRLGHGLSRIEWLETWESLEVSARPQRVVSEPGYERWDGGGALGYLTLFAAVAAQLVDPPAHARVVVCSRTFPTGALGYWVRMLAAGGLVGVLTATSPRRLAPPGGGPPLAGTNPLAIAIPSSDGQPVVVGRLDGRGHLRRRDRRARGDRGARARSAATSRTRRSRSRSACSCSSTSLTPEDEFGAVLLVARPESDPVPALRALAAGRPPARRVLASGKARLAADRVEVRRRSGALPAQRRLELHRLLQVQQRVVGGVPPRLSMQARL